MSKCPKCGSEYFGVREDDTCLSCGWHRVTVFDTITASPEVLADNLVYYLPEIDKYTSEIIADFYKERAEAIAATVARLKEVAEDD